MAAFDFPNSPALGASSNGYTWDGEKWVSPVAGAVYVSDTPPVAPVNSLWWESDTGNLYVRYYDGDSTQWVLAVPATSAASISAVTYVPQTLTAAQQTVARQNVYAAPFDAMAYSGMQINGAFEVSQERGTFAAVTAGQYVVDGWIHSWGGTAVLNSAQYPFGSYGQPNIIGCTVATAQAAMGAGDLYYFIQNLEGYRISRLGWGGAAAQPITIAFWTQHQRAGLYSLAVRNSAANRSYVATYTQDVANTREYKTITIPGCTDGTWSADNTKGIVMSFAIACGTTFTAPSVNTWLTGNYIAAVGQVNAVASTSDVFRLISVVILPGIEAPSASRSPLIMRPYDQELVTCQRYYEKTYPAGDSPGKAYGTAQGGAPVGVSLVATASYQSVPWRYQIRKRTPATAACYSPFTGAVSKFSTNNAPTDVNAAIASAGDLGCLIYVNGVSVSAGDFVFAHAIADARL